MRQKIAGRIHYMYASIGLGNSNVDMDAENQQRAGDHLQLIDEQLVPVTVIYFLLGPFRKRMRRRRDYDHSFLPSKCRDDAAKLRNVLPRLLDICTNTGTDL